MDEIDRKLWGIIHEMEQGIKPTTERYGLYTEASLDEIVVFNHNSTNLMFRITPWDDNNFEINVEDDGRNIFTHNARTTREAIDVMNKQIEILMK